MQNMTVSPIVKAGISPLGYWQKVNQSPTQTKPYNNGMLIYILVAINPQASIMHLPGTRYTLRVLQAVDISMCLILDNAEIPYAFYLIRTSI